MTIERTLHHLTDYQSVHEDDNLRDTIVELYELRKALQEKMQLTKLDTIKEALLHLADYQSVFDEDEQDEGYPLQDTIKKALYHLIDYQSVRDCDSLRETIMELYELRKVLN